MSDPNSSEWGPYLWDIAKGAFAVLNTIALGSVAWMTNRYRTDRAMLLRHEEKVIANDKELGEQRAFRQVAEKGLIGQRLTDEVKRLERRDVRIVRKINRNRAEVEEIVNRQVDMAADIRWIKEEMQRRGHGSGQ